MVLIDLFKGDSYPKGIFAYFRKGKKYGWSFAFAKEISKRVDNLGLPSCERLHVRIIKNR
jgi:hypothetical protein